MNSTKSIFYLFLYTVFLYAQFGFCTDTSIKSEFFIAAMRFICSPIRLIVSPLYQLNLPTKKCLKKVKKIKKLKLKKPIDFKDLSSNYNAISKIQSRLVVKNLAYANQHDSLTFAEKVFTNRQQQLHRHLYSVCVKSAKIHESDCKS